MDLEFHQLDLRYERLRVRNPEGEKNLTASIADVGQLIPIVVVHADEDRNRHVVIDGYKRVRVGRRLRHDTIRATRWDLAEVDALLLGRSMMSRGGETALEQAWLLHELGRRFDLDQGALGRLFDRSPSWVSRRIDLVRQLPDSVQEVIREGKIVPHAAAKCLVPMARAKPEHCVRLAEKISAARLSSRQVMTIYNAWRDSGPEGRDRIVEEPLVFLEAQEALEKRERDTLGPREGLMKDVSVIAAASRRASQRLRGGAVRLLSERDQEDLYSGARMASGSIRRLLAVMDETMRESECSTTA